METKTQKAQLRLNIEATHLGEILVNGNDLELTDGINTWPVTIQYWTGPFEDED